jgi:hypothetical protein
MRTKLITPQDNQNIPAEYKLLVEMQVLTRAELVEVDLALGGVQVPVVAQRSDGLVCSAASAEASARHRVLCGKYNRKLLKLEHGL